MINLKHKKQDGSTSNAHSIFESNAVSHPLTNGTNSVTYTLTHNFGAIPDVILVYQYVGSQWYRLSDFFIGNEHYWDFGEASSADPENVTKVQVYHITAGGARDIKFVVLKY